MDVDMDVDVDVDVAAISHKCTTRARMKKREGGKGKGGERKEDEGGLRGSTLEPMICSISIVSHTSQVLR